MWRSEDGQRKNDWFRYSDCQRKGLRRRKDREEDNVEDNIHVVCDIFHFSYFFKAIILIKLNELKEE